jgi:hypothetical protein
MGCQWELAQINYIDLRKLQRLQGFISPATDIWFKCNFIFYSKPHYIYIVTYREVGGCYVNYKTWIRIGYLDLFALWLQPQLITITGNS